MAGGSSSRFGGKPKGLEKVGGERIADRAVRVLQAAIGDRPVVIANAPDAADWFPGLVVRPDIRGPEPIADRETPAPGETGSLGGLYTAICLEDSPVLVVAWDMPFLTVDLLEALTKGTEGYDAYLPKSPGPSEVEPLCGVYDQRCKGIIHEALRNEDYRATGFHSEAKIGVMSIEEIEKFGDPEKLFYNVNTPDDLKTAEALWRQEHA